MIEVSQNGIKDTDTDKFHDYESLSEESFNHIIENLESQLSLAESDLDWVIRQKRKYHKPITKRKEE